MNKLSVAIGKAHVAGVGNCFFNGDLKVVCDESGRVIIAVDSDVDALAIELSPEGADALRQHLGAAHGQIQKQQLADHHVASLSFARKAIGAAPTLADTLLQVCESWPEPAEADRWRRAIAIEDYISARDDLARTGSGAAFGKVEDGKRI